MFQILIADSDRAYRRRLYQLLRREGYSVLQASGGEDVLKVLETSYIDIIILGDNLVDLNVYELMGQLRDTYCFWRRRKSGMASGKAIWLVQMNTCRRMWMKKNLY